MEKNTDFRKVFRELYQPGSKPHIVEVPEMLFIAVDGDGAPEDLPYQEAVSILYTLSYAIRMSYKSENIPEGFFMYTVAPLEGIWKALEGNDPNDRTKWQWTSMILQPDFVNADLFEWAVGQGRKKHPELDFSRARLEKYTEGLCVQMMHTGPYSTEDDSFAAMENFMQEKGLHRVQQTGLVSGHHEIYLNDPRRTAPEKLKTVLRIKVK